jgi:hypothetical protein
LLQRLVHDSFQLFFFRFGVRRQCRRLRRARRDCFLCFLGGSFCNGRRGFLGVNGHGQVLGCGFRLCLELRSFRFKPGR